MRIKNWNNFQHFKDRRPPWIKLHRDILEQRDINAISDRSFRVLVGLWLLASEDRAMEGNLPDIDDIAFRLRYDKVSIIKSLKELDSFLVQDDITVISERYQDGVPETETETETETENRKKRANALDYSSWPHMPDQQTLQDWLSMRRRLKANVSQTVVNRFGSELKKAVRSGLTVDDCLSECVARNWKGFKLEWMINNNHGIQVVDNSAPAKVARAIEQRRLNRSARKTIEGDIER